MIGEAYEPIKNTPPDGGKSPLWPDPFGPMPRANTQKGLTGAQPAPDAGVLKVSVVDPRKVAGWHEFGLSKDQSAGLDSPGAAGCARGAIGAELWQQLSAAVAGLEGAGHAAGRRRRAGRAGCLAGRRAAPGADRTPGLVAVQHKDRRGYHRERGQPIDSKAKIVSPSRNNSGS